MTVIFYFLGPEKWVQNQNRIKHTNILKRPLKDTKFQFSAKNLDNFKFLVCFHQNSKMQDLHLKATVKF